MYIIPKPLLNYSFSLHFEGKGEAVSVSMTSTLLHCFTKDVSKICVSFTKKLQLPVVPYITLKCKYQQSTQK